MIAHSTRYFKGRKCTHGMATVSDLLSLFPFWELRGAIKERRAMRVEHGDEEYVNVRTLRKAKSAPPGKPRGGRLAGAKGWPTRPLQQP
jgi:hypothetical protein